MWFALYRTLQTAVELYNIPFLWFPDLSSADKLYILPFVIGCTFATSDVSVTSTRMRRICVIQGVVAFFFNTIILALTINIAANIL